MKYFFHGLSDEAVLESRRTHGDNKLPPPEIESFWDKLKDNFQDPLIKILCVALVITVLLSVLGYADWFEGVGIAVAVFLATFVSTYSEFKNEASFQTLQEQASRVKSDLYRNSEIVKVFASEIVKGDYVLLQAGDKIPADGRLIAGDITVNQASLTGENEGAKKVVPPPSYVPEDSSDFNDTHLCFRGSVVEEGEGVLLVDCVGENTFYGKLAVDLSSADDRESPLQVKLSALADGISTLGYVGATFIAISFLFKQFIMDNHYSYTAFIAYLTNWPAALKDVVTSLILAIIVIVVAVPEGLPMMIAIVLSLNMRTLLRSNVLVRKLLGIETAGSLNILFVDKTGTITRGRFEPKLFISGVGRSYEGISQVPTPLASLLGFVVRESTSASFSPDGSMIGGNASDRALLGFVGPSADGEGTASDESHVVQEILFHSSRKFSASRVALSAAAARRLPAWAADAATNQISLLKGAPEIVIQNCTGIYAEDGQVQSLEAGAPALWAEMNRISKSGLRIVAIATSPHALDTTHNAVPSGCTLLGVVGILDEVRPESPGALRSMRQAGIQVVMITGDRRETAVAVAEEIGLSLDDQNLVLTSSDLQQMSDEELQAKLPEICVIARALPTDKSRLVTLAQKLELVVGMTGDGVNDSSALKKADVGFAMGSGSEVAKEASDIVILDDNFASISQSVLYGRTIFKSIRKFIVFQSTVNVASTFIVFLGPFLGYDFPLTLIQLLWVNLVMDTLAALAFGGEAAQAETMKEKPIRRSETIVSPAMWSSILCNGVFIAAMAIGFLTYDGVESLFVRDGKNNEPAFLTAFFCFFIFLTNFNAFNVRTPHLNLFVHLTDNRGFIGVVTLIFGVQILFTYLGGSVLRTVGLTPIEWLSVIAASSIIIPFDLLRKVIFLPFHLQRKFKDE